MTIVDVSKNFGHQAAILAGIQAAKGDAAIIIDGDLQDPPELIPRMLEKWMEGNEVVYARRSKRQGESAFNTFTAMRMFNFALDGITSFSIKPLRVALAVGYTCILIGIGLIIYALKRSSAAGHRCSFRSYFSEGFSFLPSAS